MVNFKSQIYLTDFLKATLRDEIAKNLHFCGGEIFKSAPVYHAGVNHAAVLRNSYAALGRFPYGKGRSRPGAISLRTSICGLLGRRNRTNRFPRIA